MRQILNLMRIKKNFLLFTLLPLITFSQFSEKKVYNIEKVQNPPKIDGELNDIVWNNLNITINLYLTLNLNINFK